MTTDALTCQALAAELDRAPVPCHECGHAWPDHRERFGCLKTTLMPDGESWDGCPCDLEPGDEEDAP